MILHPYSIDEVPFDLAIALPEGEGPHPAVLICPMWAGRNAFIDDKARALAALGYVGAGVDLYGVGVRGHDKASSAALMNGLLDNPKLLRRRLARAHAELAARPEVDAERIAVIGFCFGGLCAILAARMGLPLRAAVSFHGLLKIGARLETRPQARILVLHGQDDPMAPPEDVGAFAAEMKRIDADWQLHAYPGVVHAFTNPAANDPGFGTVYDAEADRRSWAAMRGVLAETLAG